MKDVYFIVVNNHTIYNNLSSTSRLASVQTSFPIVIENWEYAEKAVTQSRHHPWTIFLWAAGGKAKQCQWYWNGCYCTEQFSSDEIPFADDKDDSEYTHVLIPWPGIVIADRHIKGLKDCHKENQKKRRGVILLTKCFFVYQRWAKRSKTSMRERGSKVKKTNHVSPLSLKNFAFTASKSPTTPPVPSPSQLCQQQKECPTSLTSNQKTKQVHVHAYPHICYYLYYHILSGLQAS